MPRKQVAVIGLGRFGSAVARTLYQLGHDVLAIDTDERAVQEVAGQVTYPVKADATSEATLRELGVPSVDAAVVAIGSDIQASVMTTVLLKSLGVPYIVARAQTPLHGRTLERIGAQRVIYPEEEMGARLAYTLFTPQVQEHMELSGGFGINKVRLPRGWARLTLKEAGLTGPRDRYGLTVLAIHRGKDLLFLPSEEERLKEGDILVVAGPHDLLEKVRSEEAPA